MGCTTPKLEERIEEFYEAILLSRLSPKRFFDDIKEFKTKDKDIIPELDNIYFNDNNEVKSFVSSFFKERKEVSLKDILVILMLLTDGEMDDKVRFIFEIDNLFDDDSKDNTCDIYYFTHIDEFKYSISKENLLKLSFIYLDFISAHSLIRLHGEVNDNDAAKEDLKLLHITFDYDVRKGYIHKYIVNKHNYKTDFALFMNEKSKYFKQDFIRRTMLNEGNELINVQST